MSKVLACQKAVDLSAIGRVTDLWRDFGPSSEAPYFLWAAWYTKSDTADLQENPTKSLCSQSPHYALVKPRSKMPHLRC